MIQRQLFHSRKGTLVDYEHELTAMMTPTGRPADPEVGRRAPGR